ncbi:MAG: hypothetical protein ABIG95_02125 [Candidatus Woesearchaeota archaeon]
MRVDVERKSMILKASALLKYFLGTNERIDTLIKCKPENVELSCYDQSLYEALGSLQEYDEFNFRKLVKLLENVNIISYGERAGERKILTPERVEELRKEALSDKDGG